MPEKLREYEILGNSDYPCSRNLLTPYNVEKNFDKKICLCRILEQRIDILKQRFRKLYNLKSRDIGFTWYFIRACYVLQNMYRRISLMKR